MAVNSGSSKTLGVLISERMDTLELPTPRLTTTVSVELTRHLLSQLQELEEQLAPVCALPMSIAALTLKSAYCLPILRFLALPMPTHAPWDKLAAP